ncbi:MULTISPECIES: FliM/FliN family flagellar motor switch protein [Rhodomicrobium]|uniref:FliM/FliN family flagellar motor switch protein n=1 Tax=Rhodomicrobium TaxID=1068 RepID=UPI000B4A9F55|nr:MULTISPECIES: FliM/FliN family flagellar motor switch protein [Rhodomicrobium]
MREAAAAGRGGLQSGPGKVTWEPVQFAPVDPASVEALNIFYRRRSPLRGQIGGRILTFEPQWLNRRPDIPDPWTVTIRLDTAQAELVLPQSAILDLLRDLDASVAIYALPSEHRSLLVEFALSENLDALEAVLGCSVSIIKVDRTPASAATSGEPFLSFQFAGDGMPRSWGLLRAGAPHLLRLAQSLDRLRGPVPSPNMNELPLAVHLRWASVDLSYSELSSLVAGDILLADAHCKEPETVIAVIGDQLVARVKVVGDGYQLLDAPRPVKGSGLDWSAANPLPQQGRVRDGSAGDMPMRVFFELPQLQLPYARLRELRPGARIGTDEQQDPYFDLMVEGTRIGRGELTTIGTAAGARIVRA